LRRKQIKDSITLLSIDELEQVEQIYKKAAELRQSTGKMYHVDHIIRLADGGTHWPDNLQILDESTHREKTSGENRKEG
jgi:5-methylcytosine-specific restriction endonuclease McrA